MLEIAFREGKLEPFELSVMGKDISAVKKEFGAPDVWQEAGCTECDAPNTAVHGGYNLNMFPSKVRTVWIAPYISVRELKEWFGEPDDTDSGIEYE